jgi:hypothetical protein
MSSELTKQEAQAQQVQQQSASQGARDVETQEHHAKASASGGLNLNLFGALSGALSSKSKKTTHTNADGSSTSVEDRHDKGESSAPTQLSRSTNSYHSHFGRGVLEKVSQTVVP